MNPELIKWVYVLVLKYQYKISKLVVVRASAVDNNRASFSTRAQYQANEGNTPLVVMPGHVAWNSLQIEKKASFKKFLDIWCGRSNSKITRNEPWK